VLGPALRGGQLDDLSRRRVSPPKLSARRRGVGRGRGLRRRWETVAEHHDCSRRSVSRWVRWTAQLASPEDLARLCARLDPEGLPPPTPAPAAGEVNRAGSVLRLLDHLGDVLLRRGVALPGRGPGLLRILMAQLARFGDVCWLTRSSPPLRVAPEGLPL